MIWAVVGFILGVIGTSAIFFLVVALFIAWMNENVGPRW